MNKRPYSSQQSIISNQRLYLESGLSLRRADDDRVEDRWHLELLPPPPPSFPCEGETAPPKKLSLRSAAVGSRERRRIVADLLKWEEMHKPVK